MDAQLNQLLDTQRHRVTIGCTGTCTHVHVCADIDNLIMNFLL